MRVVIKYLAKALTATIDRSPLLPVTCHRAKHVQTRSVQSMADESVTLD